MSEQESLDVGKVIGLIMENPQLIEQISNLTRQKNDDTKADEAEKIVTNEENVSRTIEAPVPPTYSAPSPQRSNRAQLLGALKPYVSHERAKAIDSMISIADILEMMKSR